MIKTKKINKNKEHCNILVLGTSSSGSSALHNLLKEYDNIGHFPNEFDDFRAPGLVADQLNEVSSINFPNKIDKLLGFTNLAKRLIYKSLIWKLIFNCIPKKYRGIDYNIKLLDNIKDKLIDLYKLYLLDQLNKSLKTKIPFEEKIRNSNKWIQLIGNILFFDKKYVLYDQPILTKTDFTIWTTVFNPFKLIIVYRNPRDQIADIIERGNLFKPFGSAYMTLAEDNLEAIYGKDKKGAMRFHIDSIKNRLKWIENEEKRLGPDRLLVFDFEGLVNNYEQYKSKVEDFIGGIKDKHKFKYKYFDPVKSKENIGIYKKYLSDDDLKDLSDLEDWYSCKIGIRTDIEYTT